MTVYEKYKFTPNNILSTVTHTAFMNYSYHDIIRYIHEYIVISCQRILKRYKIRDMGVRLSLRDNCIVMRVAETSYNIIMEVDYISCTKQLNKELSIIFGKWDLEIFNHYINIIKWLYTYKPINTHDREQCIDCYEYDNREYKLKIKYLLNIWNDKVPIPRALRAMQVPCWIC